MTYLYECSLHGEMWLEHRITDDRKNRRCTKVVKRFYRVVRAPDGSKVSGGRTREPCGETLKPLIGHHDLYHDDVRPAIFKGNHWHFKTQPRWKEEHVKRGQKDPTAVR